MPTCFVIQPFDSGKFDKRFEDVYKPAIEAAGLEAYRVDRDPRVDIPIEAIEDGVRAAAVCLADITTDNPNVWYELGFAFAAGRPVIMVCSEERTGKKYPFDIQHRTIISYVADAPRDFDQLRTTLTTRIKTLLAKGEALRQIAEAEQVAPNAYAFISGDWFFYHFTCDPKMSSQPVLSMGEMALTLEKDLIVVGRDEVIKMNHRRALHYQLRGEIRAGQLFLTGVCVEDPSDAYTCIFPNLLDDETTGIMIARDYARYLYASPTLLTKKRLPEIEAERVLQRSDVRLYGPHPEVPDNV